MEAIIKAAKDGAQLTAAEFGLLLRHAPEILDKEPNMVHIPDKYRKGVCIFLMGDLADRGGEDLTVICKVFAEKCAAPTKIFMTRGNHETRGQSKVNNVQFFFVETQEPSAPVTA